jgi:hypothetical protein
MASAGAVHSVQASKRNEDSCAAALKIVSLSFLLAPMKNFPKKFTAFRSESLTEW